MVRSSGHHRKRSRSRSASPGSKRSKYEKDRLRRRSRSRDRSRRSRSRDRKKDKRDSESRFRSKPLKLKHRSRSRSRSRSGSKSKEKNSKKDEKKVDDEPFDPTNLDKVLDRDDDEEWVVTDVIEEATELDSATLEEEYDYEADEDDQYSRSSKSQPNSPDSRHRTADDENNVSSEIEISSTFQDVDKSGTENKVNGDDMPTILPDEVTNQNATSNKVVDGKDEKKDVALSDVVEKMKESSSNHRDRIRSISKNYEHEKTRRRTSSYHGYSSSRSEQVTRLSKDHIRQCIKLDKEFHDYRLRNEIARHKTELEVLRLQLDYWKKKCRKD